MLANNNKIFVVGFQKTGTTSVDFALQALGLDGIEVYSSLNPILDPDAPNAREVIRDHIIERMQTADVVQDSPCPFFFEEFDEAFPDAKFILTWRPVDSWLKSYGNFFRNRNLPLRRFMYGVDQFHGHEDRYRQIYVEQNQKIRDHFANRPGKLLQMNLAEGDGWYELVNFLGPDFLPPFPRKNVGKKKG